MRKAPAAAAKPKPRARTRAKAKAKPSPDSLSAASSSPSGASDGSPAPSPVALGRGLLSASKPKPRANARARAKPKGKPSPDSLSGASSPSDASAGSPSPSPVAAGRGGFLSPASLVTPKARSPLTAAATSTPASVGDLRGLAASSLGSLNRRLDALHADSARDLEASYSRISKRIKMQTQSCVQMAEEADKEHKKMLDSYSHQADDIKASYKKVMTDVQSSSSRVCKVTLPEMGKSVARAIDGLRSRYNIPATTA
ncbi:nascent polypeptide-associated complex subunit alpha, muscle-specific form [Triticum aestivum]|uniref:nascent polypeptide-associated complex subunit alpha, muscle-specific form n=1 Tax=Triticum aestivum TaxID=4565 RepID=UPI000843DFC6|nr:nascent polypeptide-associated complex subunit alpha, muscle-specific form-like [Triticum aestivum]